MKNATRIKILDVFACLVLGILAGMLVFAGLGCAGADDFEETGIEDDIGQAEQAITVCEHLPITAQCIPEFQHDNIAGLKFGVDAQGGRCDMGNSSKICYFADRDYAFQIGFTTGWADADRNDWANGAVTAGSWMTNQFTGWQDGANFGSYFAVQPYGWASCNANGDPPCNFRHYVEVTKTVRPTPSWWNNRATTASAPLNDLVGMACMSIGHVLTEGSPAQTVTCSKWSVQIDYDKVKLWASARGVSKIGSLNSILKKTIAHAMGYGRGSGSSVTYGNLNPQVDPTSWDSGEQAWANNYFDGYERAFGCVPQPAPNDSNFNGNLACTR